MNNEWAPHGMPLFLEFWRPPGPPQPLHFSCSGGVFSSKNTLFLEFWRPPGAPQPLHFSCSGGVFSSKTRYFSSSGAPRARPGKGAGEPRTLQPPAGLTTYHKYTSILTKRKHKPQTAHTRSEQPRLAGPRGRRTSPACGSFRRPLNYNAGMN